MALADLLQGRSNKSDTVMINKNVTRLTTQGCKNIVISWLYRTCWNSLLHTCWQLGTSSANTTCWRLVGRLATRCEIFTRADCSNVSYQKALSVWCIICRKPQDKFICYTRKKFTTCQQDVFATGLWQPCQQVVTMLFLLSSCYKVVTHNLLTNCWVARR
jgi:hypothetical protein